MNVQTNTEKPAVGVIVVSEEEGQKMMVRATRDGKFFTRVFKAEDGTWKAYSHPDGIMGPGILCFVDRQQKIAGEGIKITSTGTSDKELIFGEIVPINGHKVI